jgi:PTS system beta-glucosides-specific IIC component
MFGASGLFSFANFVGQNSGLTDLIKYSIGVLVGGVFVFVAQLITYKDEDAKNLL